MSDPTPLVLAGLALLLTGPAPAVLARAAWPSRVPRAALVLWQALALAALLSALGAGVSAGMAGVLADDPGPVLIALHAAAFSLTIVVLARLLWSAHVLGMTLRARRRRHRDVVDLVGRSDQRVPGAHVVEVDAPLAYCIPGLRSRLVVSTPALDALGDPELRAVLEHERAHVRARHDLVLEGFTAVHNAFPRIVRSRAALDAAAGLVEMLADDSARSRTGPVPLARALVALAGAPVPAGSLGAGAGAGRVTALTRVQRLTDTPGSHTRWLAAAAYLGAVAVVVVPTLTVAAPWLTRLATTLS